MSARPCYISLAHAVQQSTSMIGNDETPRVKTCCVFGN